MKKNKENISKKKIFYTIGVAVFTQYVFYTVFCTVCCTVKERSDEIALKRGWDKALKNCGVSITYIAIT